MSLQIDLKSLILGVLVTSLAVAILSLIGPDTATQPSQTAGRFQLQAADSTCYIADTTTGQVWTSRQPDFALPKVKTAPTPQQKKAAKGLLGHWRIEDPDGEDASLRIEENGKAIAYDGDKQLPASWRIVDDKIIITVTTSSNDADTLNAELAADGRLYLWENDPTDRMPFVRVE